jgi:GxxExxY protein
MLIVNGLTVDDLIKKANVVNTRIGPGRKEMHYQKCLSVELRSMGIPVVMEDPVPVYYQGVYTLHTSSLTWYPLLSI